MEDSLLAIFDKIPCTIVQGLWPNNEVHQNRAPFYILTCVCSICTCIYVYTDVRDIVNCPVLETLGLTKYAPSCDKNACITVGT